MKEKSKSSPNTDSKGFAPLQWRFEKDIKRIFKLGFNRPMVVYIRVYGVTLGTGE